MECKKCGNEIKSNWKYCPYCSENLLEGNYELEEEKSKENFFTIIIASVSVLEIMFAIYGFFIQDEARLVPFFLNKLLFIFCIYYKNKYSKNIIIKICFAISVIIRFTCNISKCSVF